MLLRIALFRLSLVVLFSFGFGLRASDSDKQAVEERYLAVAQEGIETYRKSDARFEFVDSEGKPLEGVKVEVEQVSQDFLFGNTAFDLARSDDVDDPELDAFKERFKALFNYAVLPFYWAPYEAKQGMPDWPITQASLDWCLENGIKAKGHPLGWTHPAGTPDWLLELPVETAYTLYESRVRNTVAAFQGSVGTWDVVNEPTNTIPFAKVFEERSNADKRIAVGPRYKTSGVKMEEVVSWVADSHRWADEAYPDGHYILNEFNLIAVPETLDRYCELVEALLEQAAPVDGLGIQAHEPREMWYAPEAFVGTLDRLAEYGLPLHITELIPQSSGKGITGGWREGIWDEAAQAEFADQIYTLAFGHPSVKSITWWGLSDADVWLPKGGLLDEEYQPKPVYERLLQRIKSDWMTKGLVLETDDTGVATFRGFHGGYEVRVVLPDGESREFTFSLRPDEANSRRFTF